MKLVCGASLHSISFCSHTIQVLTISVFCFSDLLQKQRILKTREHGKKHHEERRKLHRPARNLSGLRSKQKFPF